MADEAKTAAEGPLNAESAAGAFEGLLARENGKRPRAAKAQAPPAERAEHASQDETESEENETPDEAALEDAEAAESEEPETDEETEREPEEEPRKIAVKINGEEHRVTLDELKQGYQRTADYTRKTQELARERAAAAQELETARAERARYAQGLDQIVEQIRQQTPREPDWMRLANENPAEFVRQRAAFDHWNGQRAALEQQQQELREQASRDAAQANAAELAKERELMIAAIPEWKDEKRAKTELSAIVEFGLKNGLTSDELSDVTDHRVVTLLRKAMLYDKLTRERQTLRPSPPANGVRTAAPGSPRAPATDVTRAKQRLAKTGRVEDAAAVLASMI